MSAIDSATEPSALSIRSTGGADAPAFGVPTLTCSERPGIVQAVTSFLLEQGFDIVEHHQFDDNIREILFLRTALSAKRPFHRRPARRMPRTVSRRSLALPALHPFHGASTVVFR